MYFKDFSGDFNWETVNNLIDDYQTKTPPSNLAIKRQAAEYLGKQFQRRLNKKELKRLLAKANKIKNSYKKEDRNSH